MQIHSAETTTGSADSKVCDCHPVTKNRTQTLTDLITGSENTPTLKKGRNNFHTEITSKFHKLQRNSK